MTCPPRIKLRSMDTKQAKASYLNVNVITISFLISSIACVNNALKVTVIATFVLCNLGMQ